MRPQLSQRLPGDTPADPVGHRDFGLQPKWLEQFGEGIGGIEMCIQTCNATYTTEPPDLAEFVFWMPRTLEDLNWETPWLPDQSTRCGWALRPLSGLLFWVGRLMALRVTKGRSYWGQRGQLPCAQRPAAAQPEVFKHLLQIVFSSADSSTPSDTVQRYRRSFLDSEIEMVERSYRQLHSISGNKIYLPGNRYQIPRRGITKWSKPFSISHVWLPILSSLGEAMAMTVRTAHYTAGACLACVFQLFWVRRQGTRGVIQSKRASENCTKA